MNILLSAAAAALAVTTHQAPASAPAAQARDAATTVTLTGCVVPADTEDTFQLVPAQPEPARPVGTSGTSPAWTVPAYLLLGGTISFAEHANKTVEITATLEPAGAPAPSTGDTTSRTAAADAAVPHLHVQSAKVVASTCTPRAIKK